MRSLLKLNKFLIIKFFIFFFALSAYATEPVDIWKQVDEEDQVVFESIENNQDQALINIDQGNEIIVGEEKLFSSQENVIGLFDPELNDLNLNMWEGSDGEDIKRILDRIYKLNLTNYSENLLFRILFTTAYPPKNNLDSNQFLDLKIKWLIEQKRIDDIEKFLEYNKKVGEKPEAISFLIDEYLSEANIELACEKANNIGKNIYNDYLFKFKIFCLIENDRKEEAQLVYDLIKEKGFNDNFFEKKISYLLGYESETDNKILDDSLFNFYLSQITTNNFNYKPTKNTSKYIWKYLSSANLLNTEDLSEIDNEETISIYESAAALNSFDKREIFDIYKKFLFNINQYLNVTDAIKILPNYKARALVYQSVLLSDNASRKIKLAFLLKELFEKDKLFEIYNEEFSSILQGIEESEIPEEYFLLVKKFSNDQNKAKKEKIKFDNKILHRSKILKYFIYDNYGAERVEKDLAGIYKKIKRNKKYFISIKDIIVLDALKNDGIKIPDEINFQKLEAKLTVPQGLFELAENNQMGLTVLKIIEIIGEDKVKDLDPETIYFLNKIRNEILVETMLLKV